MPNHVRQKLTVVGTKNNVAAFVATAKGAAARTGDEPGSVNGSDDLRVIPLCFHMIAPLADEFSKHPYGHQGSVGYELEVAGWGVKWGPYDIKDDQPTIAESGERATYEFTCAWGPPVRALQRASLRYPMLQFYLSWGGEGPCRGRHAFCKGKVLVEAEDDYERDIKPDMPSDEEYDADENAAAQKSDAAEAKYITSHDAWVDGEVPEPIIATAPGSSGNN